MMRRGVVFTCHVDFRCDVVRCGLVICCIQMWCGMMFGCRVVSRGVQV